MDKFKEFLKSNYIFIPTCKLRGIYILERKEDSVWIVQETPGEEMIVHEKKIYSSTKGDFINLSTPNKRIYLSN